MVRDEAFKKLYDNVIKIQVGSSMMSSAINLLLILLIIIFLEFPTMHETIYRSRVGNSSTLSVSTDPRIR